MTYGNVSPDGGEGYTPSETDPVAYPWEQEAVDDDVDPSEADED